MQELDKLQVAERQLVEAIKLFFEGRDPVAIHTLVAAAHSVLRDLATQRNLEHRSIIHDNPKIEAEDRKVWIDHWNHPSNFFKHADRDADDDLIWDEKDNHHWILASVLLFLSVADRSFIAAIVYLGWITTKHPELREGLANNVVGEFCERHEIAADNFRWFRDAIDRKILVG